VEQTQREVFVEQDPHEQRPHMSLGDQTPAEFKANIKSGWLTEGPSTAVLQ
jgi:hypothetical protein